MGLTRGHISSSQRAITPEDPRTWEFSGFSQNGEDGILDFLRQQILTPNRFFIEIGSADGVENNTCWLSLVHRYSGLWVEADPSNVVRAVELFGPLNHGVRVEEILLTRENCTEALAVAVHMDPDILSLDIDSYDYFVAEALLVAGFRPRVFVVEYNSAFGPESRITVAHGALPPVRRTLADRLFYGCSIQGWRTLFARFGYSFITVESNGVNAFFVHSDAMKRGVVEAAKGLDFAENYAQRRESKGGWRDQWRLIADRQFMRISDE